MLHSCSALKPVSQALRLAIAAAINHPPGALVGACNACILYVYIYCSQSCSLGSCRVWRLNRHRSDACSEQQLAPTPMRSICLESISKEPSTVIISTDLLNPSPAFLAQITLPRGRIHRAYCYNLLACPLMIHDSCRLNVTLVSHGGIPTWQQPHRPCNRSRTKP